MQRYARRLMSTAADKSRMSRSPARSSGNEIDPGAATIEPGRKHHSGEYLHQKGRVFQYPTPGNRFRLVVNDRVLRKEMRPVWPLAGLVVLCMGLGVMTFYWSHLVHPNTTFRKSRRRTLYEIEEPEEVKYEGERFMHSPLRKLAIESPLAVLAHIQQEPPAMGPIKAEGHL